MSRANRDDLFTKNVLAQQARDKSWSRWWPKVLRRLPARVQGLLSKPDINPIPALLEELARHTPNLQFVQIGSCDGSTGDPLRPFIEKYNWSGVVVEPVPYNFDRLVKSYESFPQITCVQAAISEVDGTRIFYHCSRPNPGLPVWFEQIGSFDRNHLVKHELLHPDVSKYIIETPVASMTLATLLATYEIKHLDLLHTDVEGLDYQILTQIDFDEYRPRAILFEHLHLSAFERTEAETLLSSHGYQLTYGPMDVFAIRP